MRWVQGRSVWEVPSEWVRGAPLPPAWAERLAACATLGCVVLPVLPLPVFGVAYVKWLDLEWRWREWFW